MCMCIVGPLCEIYINDIGMENAMKIELKAISAKYIS